MIGERERRVCQKRLAGKTLQFEATAPCATEQGSGGTAKSGTRMRDLRKTLPFRQPAHQLGLDGGQLQEIRQGLAAVGARETRQFPRQLADISGGGTRLIADID